MSYRSVDSLRAGAFAPARKLSADLYDIYHCCVYRKKTPDGGQRNCPKHVYFHSKNKFEKLVHLVGFIIQNIHIQWYQLRTILQQNSTQLIPQHIFVYCDLFYYRMF
jgi:hypothetical protein